MAFRIQMRRDSSSNWAINNPVLLQAEFGVETDTDFIKIGDGQTDWNSLPYVLEGSGSLGILNSSGQEIISGATGIKFEGNVTVTSSGNLAIVSVSDGPTGGAGPTGSQGPTGPSVAILDNGVEIVGGATGIDFTGEGVTVTNIGSKAVVNITSSESAVYVVKVRFVSGNIDTIDGAEDPLGNNLIGVTGWSFNKISSQEIRIDHPKNNLAVNVMTHSQNSNFGIDPAIYISRSVMGTTTGNSVNQTSNLNSIIVKGLSGTFTGINTGAGPVFMYITWQFPSNNILI